MPKIFFAKFTRLSILPFAPGTLNKHMRTMDRVELLLITMLVIMWTCLVLMGCGMNGPAKQQKIKHAEQSTSMVSVATVDLNQDGMLDTREQAQLHNSTSNQQHVLITFVCIMGLVTVISVACGVISRRSRRHDPSKQSDQSQHQQPGEPGAAAALEPAAPEQLLSESEQSERLRRPRPEDEQFQI
jgi:heme/copper-type cytochrome/quinol oxidase subunit 2